MTAITSPYRGEPEGNWSAITERLLNAHPLKPGVILDVAQGAWRNVWNTTIGSGKIAVRLETLKVPATVVGYFFEVLFAREMALRAPDTWRGNKSGDEKDLVHIEQPELSVEIKTSGQPGYRIFGNRSYGQTVQNQQQAKKEKSGYYITVNFIGRTITLIRFGWIDADDWKPQKSPTGQMAGLSNGVYAYKLPAIPGDYQLNAPVQFLANVGPKKVEILKGLGIATIRDLVESKMAFSSKQLNEIRDSARQIHGASNQKPIK